MAGFQIQMKQIGTKNDNIIVHNLYPTNRDVDIMLDNGIINTFKLNTSLANSTVNGVLKYIWEKFDSYYKVGDTITTGEYSDYTNTAHNYDKNYESTIQTINVDIATSTTFANVAYQFINEYGVINTNGDTVSSLLPISKLQTNYSDLNDPDLSGESYGFISTYLAYNINNTLQSYLKTYIPKSSTVVSSDSADLTGVATYDSSNRNINSTYLKKDGSNCSGVTATYANKALDSYETSSATYLTGSGSTYDVLGRSLNKAVRYVCHGRLYSPATSAGTTATLGSVVSSGSAATYLFFIEHVGILYMNSSSTSSSMFMTRFKVDNSLLKISRPSSVPSVGNYMLFTATYSSSASVKHRLAYSTTKEDGYLITYRVPSASASAMYPNNFITKQKIGDGQYIYKTYYIDNLVTKQGIDYNISGTTATLSYFEPTAAASVMCTKSTTNGSEYNSYSVHRYPINIINLGLQFAIFKL